MKPADARVKPQPRAADDFAAIRARMEELRREQRQIATGNTVVATRVQAPRPASVQSGSDRLHPIIRRLLARGG